MEINVAATTFAVRPRAVQTVALTQSSDVVILVPTPGPPGDTGPRGPAGNNAPSFNEPLTGTIDGVNAVFTTADVFQPSSTRVYVNGLRESLGVAYTETGTNQITFADPPGVLDTITIDYLIA